MIDITVRINGLRWMIVYDRGVIERLTENRPEFFDRFIRDRAVIDGYVIEGTYDPKVVSELRDLTGYRLADRFRTLLMDFPILVDGSVPVERVIFVKDFSGIVREALFTPFLFFVYTIILVVVLSVALFLMFNPLVRDISMLRRMTYRFKELDFSDTEKLSNMLRKERRRDELYYLKRSILTMAQELEALISQLREEKDKLEELAYTDPPNRSEQQKVLLGGAKETPLRARCGRHRSEELGSGNKGKYPVLGYSGSLRRGGVRNRTPQNGRERNPHGCRKVKVDGKEMGTTVSVGIAVFEGMEDMDSLIKEADEALYEAKKTSKDKVVIRKGERPSRG